ncbi:sugar phosphate isomerase/epimerase family protein [Paenibacillus eucommiae]|uniref:Sugar phosphate isomerase/epimerase n=1 Tax=Paenibacillus eucommiae TaxID=1355755 RepID=A0ABS4IX01_9BACL|nr:sugar phosphate isomerase/epimerase family protein [Paenibacillus eucommiae]MBP1992104.1 sugar phosphate isomerase/epimerase [Paenibacillus eucommiae]
MKLGISSYSLHPSLGTQEIDILQAMEWMKEQKVDHVEITPIGIDLEGQPELVDAIAAKARQLDLEVANFAVAGDVLKPTMEEFEQEIARLKKQVETAARLGALRMRHDVVAWDKKPERSSQFEEDFAQIVEACGIIADYAAGFGITTTIENHGFYITPSDRVMRIVDAVNRPNFKLLLDVGNFLCVDEDPYAAVKQAIGYAAIVHFKDFYIRKSNAFPGEGWIQTLNGNYIRGSIFGQGDMDMRRIIQVIKDSGFEGPISIEFEGMEPDKTATRMGYENARRLWKETV